MNNKIHIYIYLQIKYCQEDVTPYTSMLKLDFI